MRKWGFKNLNDSKVFIEYYNDMDNIYKTIDEDNPNKKRIILILFDDMIADMLSNKKRNPIVTELFIRGRKLNISLVFIMQSYFAVRVNSTPYFMIKNLSKWELCQTAFNHSSDIDFKDFINLYKKCAVKSYSFVVIYNTLAWDNQSCFRIKIF